MYSGPSSAGAAKAACPADGFIQLLNFRNDAALDRCNDHLGDTHLRLDDERFLAKVYQRDNDLPAIVRIDCSGRIGDGDTKLRCQSTARTYLCFIARRQRHGKPAGNTTDIPRLDRYWAFVCTVQIHSCSMFGLILRHDRMRRETFDSKGDWIHRNKCTISRKKNAASIGRSIR